MTIKTKLKNGVAVQTTVYPSFGVPVPDYPLLMETGDGKTVMLNQQVPHDPDGPRSVPIIPRR